MTENLFQNLKEEGFPREVKERRFPALGQKLLPGLEFYGKNYDLYYVHVVFIR